MCLPVGSDRALHTHLNNETVAEDVTDNCLCYYKLFLETLTVILNSYTLEE